MARFFATILILCFFPTLVLADKPKPALVYLSTKQSTDSAFIASAMEGAARANKDYDISFTSFPQSPDVDAEKFLSDIAQKGYSPIICLGSQHVKPISEIANKYPNTHFILVDGIVPPRFANVQSITFKDHEGAFLVGMIAAHATETDVIGFIGGMDIPVIRNFKTGFEQGARYVKPKIKVLTGIVGDTGKAWSDPDKAYQIATQQYKSGADIVFAAAGGSGLGSLRAAADAHRLAIGVDTNQNALYPGYILTSMIKRVDLVVYRTLKDASESNWNAGIKALGIKEAALDYSVDQYNRTLINEELIDLVSSAKERILNGLLVVEGYNAGTAPTENSDVLPPASQSK